MNDGFITFMFGIILGAFISWVFTYGVYFNNYIIECEKELPRNQNCKVIAVPEDK